MRFRRDYLLGSPKNSIHKTGGSQNRPYKELGWLLLILFSFGCSLSTGSAPAAQTATSTPVPTAPAVARPTYTVERGDVQEIFSFSGRWLPRDQMQLSFEVAGTVRRVNVQRGDAVRKGDLLADLEITDLENQLASAQLNLESANANLTSGTSGTLQTVEDAQINLANARISLENTKAGSPWTSVASARLQLDTAEQNLENAQRSYNDMISRADQGATSVDSAYQQVLSAQDSVKSAEFNYFSAAQNFNSYQYQIEQAENQVIQAELALERAQSGETDPSGQEAVLSAQLQIDQLNASIARSSLYAPIDGEILEVNIQPGDAAQAYTTVITIGIPEPKEAIATLAINDANNLSVGMVGVCQVANQPATAVQCVVRQIPLSSTDADQTTRVAASLENVPNGQLIEVDMPLEVRQAVLWLPPAAIRTFQSRIFVVLDTPDGERSADVELGLQTDDRVEILSGVNEGDVVVAP